MKAQAMKAPQKSTVTLPNDRDVVVVRAFNAPRDLVFDAWTKPELVQRWLLGPPGWTMPVCEMDVRARRQIPLALAQREERQRIRLLGRVSRGRAAVAHRACRALRPG